MNLLLGKTIANKNSDIFLRIIHNICKIKLTPSYFSYIKIFAYISYQMHELWSFAMFYHLLNRFPQATVLVLAENDLI